ncbi:MAG: hypothetical protein KME35_00105 [Aphanocapsa sp. GSE-SYN-MK-11-07L]|jgi:hypothetical protein|nr:hypothetical protein [Aphanocapsa sp. GSE-SYN-MK-11-07L]
MKNLDRSKVVAILTGAIALLLSFAYLILVQLLDFRGEMLPAPQSQLTPSSLVALGCNQGPTSTQIAP